MALRNKPKGDAPTTDVAATEIDWSGVKSMEAAVAASVAAHGGVEHADEVLGDGFQILPKEDRNRLVGVPVLFAEWAFRDGEFGQYVSARVILETGNTIQKWILNDGSTGICAQLQEYTMKTGKKGGLFVQQGIRSSEYTYTDDKGKTIPATTWYIAA